MSDQSGRNVEPVPGSGALTDFVADLARLRRDAGQPSLRRMAEKAHYSHTALSSVLSGTRLPSLELTLAFVRACGADEDVWRERWNRQSALLNGAVPLGAAAPAAPPGAPRPVPVPVPGQPRPRWARLAAVGGAAIVALTIVAVAAPRFGGDPLGSLARDGSASAPAVPPAAADGSDPQEQRCHLDAMSTHTVQIPDLDPALPSYGSLTLRFSPRCQAAWPLFVSTERVPTGATIRLSTTRPSDGAVTRFDYPFMVPSQVYSVYGNVLQTTEGCVTVGVEISSADNRESLASADTPCAHLDAGP
ncbi:helix-turn-helix domain-containing protein [Micromonospora sp. NBC_01813]|uniref:helix-turn-helix domain-containing protein n=1 Tax=Micromonospora sp. NBC_01813 TaxID=2975988 RepID=UPI002DD8D0D2|nr:helix-turn-helix domain-containing protein [Micromonospora sp. NBC_01813]WSA10173.1 XRE family transcriptional regulator [Micromonospora sp. NBC_01813]